MKDEEKVKKMELELSTDKVQDPENEFPAEAKEAVLKELNFVDLPPTTFKGLGSLKV